MSTGYQKNMFEGLLEENFKYLDALRTRETMFALMLLTFRFKRRD